MLDKLLLSIIVLFYSLTGLIPSCHAASNISVHKPYTVSPIQNYELTAQSTDTTSLTDGKFTSGYFWTQKSTLGWQNVRTVEIMIDLRKSSNIDSIVFNTARGTQAGVNYPAQIAAFVGPSRDQFYYVGDVANDPGNVIGSYQTKKFTLNGISTRGRYVLLEVRLSGSYLFCDEIEVIEGAQVTQKTGALTLEDARVVTEKLRRLDIEKEFLTSLIDKLKSTIILDADSMQIQRLAEIQQQVNTLTETADAAVLEADILNCRAALLQAKFPGKRFLLETVNPWAPLSPLSAFVDTPQQTVSMTIPQGGYDYAALVVTNLTAESQQLSIQPNALPLGAPALAFYQVPFVKSAIMEYVADPLMPISGSLTLRPGESKMIFLAAYGEHPGTWKSTFNIENSLDVTSLPLNLQVSSVALPVKFTLNSVNWGYLDFKPIRDRKSTAVKDLFVHHTNTIVVPSEYLPLTCPTKPDDVIRLDSYLQLHKGAAKILFFVNFNNEKLLTANGKYPFMSTEWKKAFKKFYSGIVNSAARADFPESALYLYPFDEMGGADIDRFIELATWAYKEIPSIKFYATLDKKESFKALPYMEIAQVLNKEELIADAIASKKEIWLYGTEGNTKSFSPYSYYRLMPWTAFYHGFSGVGFWNYADTGWEENPGSAWDDFDGNRPDFAVIYEGENGTIVSSRRWEAWRMGVEDYELLRMYATAKGEVAAKMLASSVLDKPQEVGKADEVRRKILMELSQ